VWCDVQARRAVQKLESAVQCGVRAQKKSGSRGSPTHQQCKQSHRAYHPAHWLLSMGIVQAHFVVTSYKLLLQELPTPYHLLAIAALVIRCQVSRRGFACSKCAECRLWTVHCTQTKCLLAHHHCPATVLNARFGTCIVQILLPDIAFDDTE
jgi:hypothetical protein